MLTRGISSLIARVATRPSTSGIRMSISTRSGCSWRDSSTASRPVAASPTTSRSGSGSSIVLSPSRASSWSSAMMTRPGRGPGGSVSDLSGGISLPHSSCLHEWHFSNDLGALARLTHHDAAAAQERDTLLHAQQADALARARTLLLAGGKAATPVAHLQPHRIALMLQRDGHEPPSAVLADVRQRFLSDPKQGGLDLRRQPRIADVLVVRHL